MAKAPEHIAKLGITSNNYYIGFQPPLTDEQINAVYETLPDDEPYGGADYISCSQQPDSTEIGFFSDRFGYDPGNTRFIAYAGKIARVIGYELDPTVREIGPGPSLIAQANGARPEW